VERAVLIHTKKEFAAMTFSLGFLYRVHVDKKGGRVLVRPVPFDFTAGGLAAFVHQI